MELSTVLDLRNQLESAEKTIESLTFEVSKLTGELEWFRRQIFGSKSERFITNDQQCELALGVEPEVDTSEKETKDVSYTRTTSKKKDKGHGRSVWPSNLTREKKVIPPDFDTTGYTKISEKVTETLQYTPPKFWILEEVRGVYKKETDEGVDIRSPELPPRVIDQGNVGASVIAQLLVDKCTFHQPLYRLTRKWNASSKIDIPDSNAYDWFAKGCFWLDALRLLMLEKITGSGYVQLDESAIKVQIKEKKGKCHLGSMLVVHSPVDKLVVFTYRSSKNKLGPGEVLGNSYKGILQTDCCPSYNSFASLEKVEHAGCNAHSRRYFEEALSSDRKNATYMLELYQELFSIERKAKDQGMSFDERLILRQTESQPIVEDMKTWLDERVKDEIPKGKLGKAITYSLNHWKQLTYFLKNGIVESSNNWIENVIRLLALGKRNFMFAGSLKGAHNLATAYSIMATCRLNNINPYDYTLDVLQKLPTRDANDIEDLIPTKWAEIKNKISE